MIKKGDVVQVKSNGRLLMPDRYNGMIGILTSDVLNIHPYYGEIFLIRMYDRQSKTHNIWHISIKEIKNDL